MNERSKIVAELDALQVKVDALKRLAMRPHRRSGPRAPAIIESVSAHKWTLVSGVFLTCNSQRVTVCAWHF